MKTKIKIHPFVTQSYKEIHTGSSEIIASRVAEISTLVQDPNSRPMAARGTLTAI